jgi:outer membrane protein assembly factor BamB
MSFLSPCFGTTSMHRRGTAWLAVCVAAWLAAAGCTAAAADWTHWRGATRDGRTAETSGWEQGGWPPHEVWRIDAGEGASSPLVVGPHVYVLGWRDGEDRLACLDVRTGRELWAAVSRTPKYGRVATGDESFYSGPSSTPEYDAATGLIYTLGIDGELQCFDTARAGARIWGMNLYDRYQVGRRPKVGRSGLRDYGYTSSPLLLGDQLVVEVGSTAGTLVAFDPRTGAERWRSEATDPAGHSGGPVPIVVEGVPCVAVHHFNGLLVARADPAAPDVGRTVATWPWRTDFANNIATPAVHGSAVVMTSAYNQSKIARLDLTLRGAMLAWEQPFASKVCSPVIHEGCVYWAWRQVHCLDFATGKPRWRGGRLSDPGSCVIAGDGRMLTWTDAGDLRLVETAAGAADDYRELAAVKGVTAADAWPHVVLANGRIFCRDRSGTLVCLQLMGAAAPGAAVRR